MEDELRFHLEARARELTRNGMAAAEAERKARRRLGNSLALREQSRDIRLTPRVEALWRDLRFAVRVLSKDRVVTIAAVASLALAIGACTAAFSLIDAMILRPLPVYQPERLIYLSYSYAGPAPSVSFSYPMLQRLRAVSAAQLELFAASAQSLSPAAFDRSEPEKIHNQFVSGNFFAVVGVTPALGRVLTPNDDLVPGAHPVAVLSQSFWMRRFGGSPAVLGQWFEIAGKRFQIVGVARHGFTGVEPGILTDVWTPMMMGPAEALKDWRWQWFRILGRLKPGVAAAQTRHVLQAAFTNARRDWGRRRSDPTMHRTWCRVF